MAERYATGWKRYTFVFAAGSALGYILHNFRATHQSLLASKLFDWPSVTLVLVASVVALFFEPLTAAISRGELTIAWGKDQSISIRNLSSAVSAELDPIREEITALKEAIGKLQVENQGTLQFERIEAAAAQATGQLSGPSEALKPTLEFNRQRLREALSNPKYRWRSIERLASIIASSEADVTSLLLSMDDVRLSRGMNGNQLAGLKSRIGSA